ncbi:MAG: FAD-binding protein, partial [Nodosilinea sp.]
MRSSTLLHGFSPNQVVHPDSEAKIVQVVQNAAAKGMTVRAIGSMHSYAPIFSTEGICIVLDRYNRLVQIDGNLVTVEAGMKISELNELLANHNLALPIVSAIDQQTVSGAILTGTHGGSLHHPSMSGYVHQLRLIRADGSVVSLGPSQPHFQAAVVSMGLLGIISTVTFQCVSAFDLEGESKSLSMDELLE